MVQSILERMERINRMGTVMNAKVHRHQKLEKDTMTLQLPVNGAQKLIKKRKKVWLVPLINNNDCNNLIFIVL